MYNLDNPLDALNFALQGYNKEFQTFMQKHPHLTASTIIDPQKNTTVLMVLAAQYSSPPKIESLVTHNPNGTITLPGIDMQDNSGDTALIIAARENNFKNVSTLLSRNGNETLRNKAGENLASIMNSKAESNAYNSDKNMLNVLRILNQKENIVAKQVVAAEKAAAEKAAAEKAAAEKAAAEKAAAEKAAAEKAAAEKAAAEKAAAEKAAAEKAAAEKAAAEEKTKKLYLYEKEAIIILSKLSFLGKRNTNTSPPTDPKRLKQNPN